MNRIKTIDWLLPESLVYDVDLNNEDEPNKKYFGDNLEINVTDTSGHSFKTSRRFVVVMNDNGGVTAFPENGWTWDEHNQLEEDERELLFDLYDDNYKTLLPTNEFLMDLYRKFFKKED